MKGRTESIWFGIVLLSVFVKSASDNRGQCTKSFSGIVCYPVDCCGWFVQCVNGVLYPPQVMEEMD